MQSRTIDLGGPVHYVDYGGEGPPMVLVHGLGGSHVNWGLVGPSLARRHRVVAIDLAGFGRTPLGARTTKLESNAELIGEFVDAVAGEPAVLVGNSMGGLLSMMVAAQDRGLARDGRLHERVRALVLVDAVHPPAPFTLVDREVALTFATYMVPRVGEYVMRTRAARLSADVLVREMLEISCADPASVHPDAIASHVALAEERREMSWANEAFLIATRSLLRTLFTPGKLRRMAEGVRAPTLVLHGDRDRLVPLAAARAAARRHRWDLEVLRGVGHVPQLEVPQRFVELVEGWLDRIEPGARSSDAAARERVG